MYARILGLGDGAGGSINDWYCYFGNSGSGFNGQWRGTGVPENTTASGTAVNATWTLTPGDYTIRLTFREDGCAVDKLCLQLETGVANPTDAGPPESVQLQNGPFILSQTPATNAAGVYPTTAYRVQIHDGFSSSLSATDPVLQLNGSPLTIVKAKVGAVTTVDAASTGSLPYGSTNELTLTYQDSAANNYTSKWSFVVATPVVVPNTFKTAPGQVNTTQPGFLVNVHQAVRFDTNTGLVSLDNTGFANTEYRAEGQLRGYYTDPATGEPYTNNFDAGASRDPIQIVWGDGTDTDFTQPETWINFDIYPYLAGATDNGNFVFDGTAPDGYGGVDVYPPGFGTRVEQMNTNNIAAEFLTYLDLPAGHTRLGVNSDDGFRVSCGLNPRDRYDTNKVLVLGRFEGGRGSADTLFDIHVNEAGIYPIRLLWYQGTGGADLEFFSVKADGTKVLVNDIASGLRPGNVTALRAYRTATIIRNAVVDLLDPAPNATGVATNATLTVQLGNTPDATVNQGSIRLYVNEVEVSATKAEKPPRTILTYALALSEGTTNTARVEFTDSLANSVTQSWSFLTATTAVAGVQGELTRKLWNNILPSAGTIPALTSWSDFTNNINYNDQGEAGVLNAFEQAQFANPTKDNYGQQFLGYIKPLVSDWYTFYLSSDDHSELWLSTNSSPVGRRLIAFMRSSNSNREYTLGRYVYQRRSIPIYLEAGQRYFVEGLHKEGTGGDHFAVTWWRTNEPAIVTGSAPISGAALEKFVGAAFTAHPQSRTTSKGKTVVLSASAYVGVGTVSYQWLKGGSPVSGANGFTHVISPADVGDSGIYKLRITVDGVNYDSQEATINILDDSIAPAVAGTAYAMNDEVLAAAGGPGYTVALPFTEELDLNSVLSATITISGGASTTERLLGGSSSNWLFLKLSTPPTGPAFTVTLSGITDLAGNPLPASTVAPGIVSTYTPMILGTPGADPIDISGTVAFGLSSNAFLVTANGLDIWGTADAGHFLYRQWDGDFDARVRVESLTWANDWSKAGIMARENLTPGSRNTMVLVTPNQGANNLYNVQWRDVADAASASKAAGERLVGITYPNAWLRLIRQGDTFTTMLNTNGSDWFTYHQYTFSASLPSQLYVGLATTSHDNIVNDLTTATYRDFQIGPYVPPATPPEVVGGGIRSDGNVELQFNATGSYKIWATTNIALPRDQWTLISSGPVTGSPMVVPDLNATNHPMRFYLISSP